MYGIIRRLASFLAIAVALGSTARAQESRFTIDGTTSLAWWQVSEPRAHLWGTSCPEDPGWQGGEGAAKTSVTRHFNIADSTYAQHLLRRAAGRCADAVRGSIEVSDRSAWRGVRGTIILDSRALVSGATMRDAYVRKIVLEVDRYPEIRFTIDSLSDVEGNETIRATAMGTFELRGHSQLVRALVVASRQSEGLRVRARFEIPIARLIAGYGVSRTSLGTGADKGAWKGILVGVDVVLSPATRPMAASPD